jgi:hypothetical protein
MTIAIVVFPPNSGGNHLRNLISLSSKYSNNSVNSLYEKSYAVHNKPGNNLKKEQFDNILTDTDNHLLHGHFGEIMSYQHRIRAIKNKKFIIICADTNDDRQLFNTRNLSVKYSPFHNQDYFFGEQVFLYEPFMYHYYFDVSMEDIMNIPITEWFIEDITPVLARINYFLQINIDIDKAQELHKIWYKNNFI